MALSTGSSTLLQNTLGELVLLQQDSLLTHLNNSANSTLLCSCRMGMLVRREMAGKSSINQERTNLSVELRESEYVLNAFSTADED